MTNSRNRYIHRSRWVDKAMNINGHFQSSNITAIRSFLEVVSAQLAVSAVLWLNLRTQQSQTF